MEELMNASNTFTDMTPAQLRAMNAWDDFCNERDAIHARHDRTCETCFHHGRGFCSFTNTEDYDAECWAYLDDRAILAWQVGAIDSPFDWAQVDRI